VGTITNAARQFGQIKSRSRSFDALEMSPRRKVRSFIHWIEEGPAILMLCIGMMKLERMRLCRRGAAGILPAVLSSALSAGKMRQHPWVHRAPPRLLMLCIGAMNPPPNPSQEGNCNDADESQLPSWEGSGVRRVRRKARSNTPSVLVANVTRFTPMTTNSSSEAAPASSMSDPAAPGPFGSCGIPRRPGDIAGISGQGWTLPAKPH